MKYKTLLEEKMLYLTTTFAKKLLILSDLSPGFYMRLKSTYDPLKITIKVLG
jgi:hypothetical protein